MLTETLVEVRRVSKSYDRRVPILKNVSFRLERGEMVALIGASGSGKSTLIRAIAGLVPIDKRRAAKDGEAGADAIFLFGQPMQQNGRIIGSAKHLRARIGVVFQQFNLVSRLPVLTNVCLSAEEKRRAMRALDRVGMAEHALKRGSELSGGQQQRAAIARTLVQGAELLIADEPIASLDPNSARRVMDILADLNRRDRITVLVSLHQVEYGVKYCPRTIALKAGEVVYDGPSCALTPELLNSIYGAESSDLFLPSREEAGISLHAAPAAPGRSSATPRPPYLEPQYPPSQRLQPAAAAAV
jgi:phosphonate transport system ATP-binding protein